MEDLVKAPIVRRIDHGARIHDKREGSPPVFRAEVTVHLADALVRELLPGWEPGGSDGRLTSPPELIGYLTAVAARASSRASA